MSSGTSPTGLDRIIEELKACNIRCVTSLPDDWMIPLLNRVDQEPQWKHIRVAREMECVGITAGAFFAGAPSVAVMGIAGLLTCFHEFATLSLTYQMPMFILASRRGGLDDPRTYQTSQGTVGISSLEAMMVNHHTIDNVEDLSQIGQAYTRSRLLKRPYICFVTKRVLEHGLKEELS